MVRTATILGALLLSGTAVAGEPPPEAAVRTPEVVPAVMPERQPQFVRQVEWVRGEPEVVTVAVHRITLGAPSDVHVIRLGAEEGERIRTVEMNELDIRIPEDSVLRY